MLQNLLPLQTVVDFAAFRATNDGGESGEAGRKEPQAG